MFAMPRSRPSFTLLEMIMVLALLLMLAAISIPALETMYGDYRVTAAAASRAGSRIRCRKRPSRKCGPGDQIRGAHDPEEPTDFVHGCTRQEETDGKQETVSTSTGELLPYSFWPC